MSTLRFVVVGAGLMAGTWWERGFRGRDAVSVVAVVDPVTSAAKTFADRIGLPSDRIYARLAEALDAVPADAVLLTSPPSAHAVDAILAAQRGLHVLTEKPIAASIAEARAMVDASDRAGVRLMVTQNRRYEDWAPTVRALVESGSVGRLGGIHAEHFIGTLGAWGYRAELPHIFLEDMAIHHLDLIRHLSGQDVVRVSARLHNPSYSSTRGTMSAFLLMDLADGTPATYTGSWFAPGRRSGWGADWRIQGETGAIHVDHDKVSISRGRGRETRVETPVDYQPTPDRGQALLMDRFLESIRTGTPAETSGRDNLWTLGIVEAAIRSHETGHAVEVEPLVTGR